MTEGKFPNFIIIGAKKSGTTSLWHNLNLHPDITMCSQDIASGGTEMNFWKLKNQKKGIKWYKSHFIEDFCGEKSPTYMYRKERMDEISKYIPEVKLIIVLRNPVDRDYSGSQQTKRGGKLRGRSLEDILIAQKKHSLYYQTLMSNVLPSFPRENIHVVINEWMRHDPNFELNKVYDFLGFKGFVAGVKYFLNPGHSVSKKSNPVHQSRGEYQDWRTEYPDLDHELRKKLLLEYESENEKIFKWLGYEVKEWNQ